MLISRVFVLRCGVFRPFFISSVDPTLITNSENEAVELSRYCVTQQTMHVEQLGRNQTILTVVGLYIPTSRRL